MSDMESKAHTEGVTRHNEDGLVEEFDKEAQGHHGQHGHHDHHEHRITTTHGIVEAAALFRGMARRAEESLGTYTHH